MSLKDFIVPKLKFAATSLTASLFDYVLYQILVHTLLSPVPSNIISSSCSMVINFFMQKRFIFILKRKVYKAFFLSVTFSIIGILTSTTFIYLLNQNTFFAGNQYLTKFVVMSVIFFYNFYMKRFAFEKSLKMMNNESMD